MPAASLGANRPDVADGVRRGAMLTRQPHRAAGRAPDPDGFLSRCRLVSVRWWRIRDTYAASSATQSTMMWLPAGKIRWPRDERPIHAGPETVERRDIDEQCPASRLP